MIEGGECNLPDSKCCEETGKKPTIKPVEGSVER